MLLAKLELVFYFSYCSFILLIILFTKVQNLRLIKHFSSLKDIVKACGVRLDNRKVFCTPGP